MYKNVLQSIEGIATYPVFSFVLFFVFFIALGVYVFTLDKGFIQRMKDQPLHDTDNPSNTD
ncbi:MAG: CcoQ/FixQ family Cbb3-type cytochrome c oxidase assembly chaperone [Cytophagales bacterium]|nr:CcoQ/FixQ family Cbb3-type cytochrome c oxidase assembly chaperone [Cytophagales bacterium]